MKNVQYVLLVAAFLISCPISGFAQEQSKKSSDQTKQTSKYMKRVSQLRNLSPRERVPVQEMTRKKLREYLEKKMKEELPPELAQKWEQTLQTFGVFPENKSLFNTLKKLLEQNISGLYDPETKKLYLIRNENTGEQELFSMENLAKQLNISPREMFTVHELTHALQDQHFNLETLPLKQKHQDDQVLAIKALVEGGATFMMYDYLLQNKGLSLTSSAGFVKPGLKKSIFSSSPVMSSDDAPLFLQKMLIFPYTGGLMFVLDGMGNEGTDRWKRINRAYNDLPASTEQILHPEKYFEKRDFPIRLTFPELSPLKSTGYNILQRNNFGEYGIHLIFLEFFPDRVKNITRARSGWDGDRYLSFHNREKNRSGYAWYTTWDSRTDAREFASLYSQLLSKKWKDAKTFQNEGQYLFLKNRENTALVHRSGSDVLVLEGVSFSNATPIARTLWTKTQKTEVRSVKRVKQNENKK